MERVRSPSGDGVHRQAPDLADREVQYGHPASRCSRGPLGSRDRRSLVPDQSRRGDYRRLDRLPRSHSRIRRHTRLRLRAERDPRRQPVDADPVRAPVLGGRRGAVRVPEGVRGVLDRALAGAPSSRRTLTLCKCWSSPAEGDGRGVGRPNVLGRPAPMSDSGVRGPNSRVGDHGFGTPGLLESNVIGKPS